MDLKRQHTLIITQMMCRFQCPVIVDRFFSANIATSEACTVGICLGTPKQLAFEKKVFL